jgi:Ca-activated chloride channel family protein
LRDKEKGSRIVVLLTDGENNSGEISPIGAAEAAKSLGVKVYTIATGQKGRVPVPSMSRNGRVVRDAEGKPLYRGDSEYSNYDEESLEKIASLTGGRFFRAQQDGDLEKIYEDINQLATTIVELRSFASLTELFYWPAFLGLALLTLELTLSNTRYRRLP